MESPPDLNLGSIIRQKPPPRVMTSGSGRLEDIVKNRIFLILWIIAFLFISYVVIGHLRISLLPSLCFSIGILIRLSFRSGYLVAFSFLFPILPAAAGLENKGLPLNYLMLPLFLLGGVALGGMFQRRKIEMGSELPKYYVPFLGLLAISFIFVLVRWSNLGLSPLALFKDIPVAPGDQRLSFAVIFPVVEFALFAISPLFYLLVRRSSNQREIIIAFLLGQSISVVVSFLQRATQMVFHVPRGLASDPTAFGFLCCVALLTAWHFRYRQQNPGDRRAGLVFAVVAWGGLLNSAVRIGFFAAVLGLILFVVTSKNRKLSLVIAGSILATTLLGAVLVLPRTGFHLLNKLKQSAINVERSTDVKDAIHHLTGGREVLWSYSWNCLKTYPVTGVGSGNFLFWVMFTQTGKYFHHLPANQYFSLATSSGLAGLALFLLCFGRWFRRQQWPERCLLGFVLFLFLFNDYLWFPEGSLAFWLVCSLGVRAAEPHETEKTVRPALRVAAIGGFILFAAFNALAFYRLHPKTWARSAAYSYDYGFYAEADRSLPFRWTGEKAGLWIGLDSEGRNDDWTLACGAPLDRLPGQRQVVDVYWRGRRLERIVFSANNRHLVLIVDLPGREGFLEFRVHPTFNLDRMGLGPESRTLGIQLFRNDTAVAPLPYSPGESSDR